MMVRDSPLRDCVWLQADPAQDEGEQDPEQPVRKRVPVIAMETAAGSVNICGNDASNPQHNLSLRGVLERDCLQLTDFKFPKECDIMVGAYVDPPTHEQSPRMFLKRLLVNHNVIAGRTRASARR